jgi:hypothetical protein
MTLVTLIHKRESEKSAPDRPSPLSHASEGRRQKVLALARDGKRYAVYVEDPNTDPVAMALATPDGTYELQIPRDRYDPFAVLAIVQEWEGQAGDPDRLCWRIAILEPGGQTIEGDTPSGWTCPTGKPTPSATTSLGATSRRSPSFPSLGYRSTWRRPYAPPASG